GGRPRKANPHINPIRVVLSCKGLRRTRKVRARRLTTRNIAVSVPSKAEFRALFLRILPTMILTGGFLLGLRFCLQRYFGVDVSGYIYIILWTGIATVISKNVP
ncbi:MAG TPA: hypothetical protein VKV96_21800, partial [Roseiarcus sp.]|nr:hypothetical protein [Roseiarcus sp.]